MKSVTPQPMINVRNVDKSSRWYQSLLGCKSGHGGDEYEMLMSGKQMILQLHAWDVDHHHGAMGDPKSKMRGNGLVLWFLAEDFDGVLKRIKKLKPKVEKAVHLNPNANHREIWLRDLDGYLVVVASPYDDV